MNVRKHIKNLIHIVVNTKLANRPSIRLRVPVDKEGKWIGWSDEEVANFLKEFRIKKKKINDV